jgi:arsenite methyltransferase
MGSVILRFSLIMSVIMALLNTGCRSNWQKPEKVIETIDIGENDIIADIGAGRGYFTFRFADTEGFNGKVYAVEVDRSLYERILIKADENNPGKVFSVLGTYTDPNLPEKVDIIFLCNVYHHIENTVAYFSNLSKYLNESGRIVIIDLDNLPWYLFALRNHQTPAGQIIGEMKNAGYTLINEYDFLPLQNFLIFESAGESYRRILK